MTLVAVQAMWALDFTSGNLSYRVIASEDEDSYGTVMVLGLSSEGSSASNLSLVIPSLVLRDGEHYIVNRILDGAFKGKTNIKSVRIKYNMLTIGSEAFKNCTSLQEVRIPGSVNEIQSGAFSGCSSLSKVYCTWSNPRNKSIATDAFPSNTGMELTAPPTAGQSLEDYKAVEAFKKFAVIKRNSHAYDFSFTDGVRCCVTQYADKNIYGKVTVTGFNPDAANVTNASIVFTNDGYYYHENLKYWVTSISTQAFYNNANILGVDFSKATMMTSVGEEAFAGSALKSVTLPESITRIGKKAFCNTKLTQVEIPESIKNIGDSAFFSINSLTKIIIKGDNTSLSTTGKHMFGCNSNTFRCYVRPALLFDLTTAVKSWGTPSGGVDPGTQLGTFVIKTGNRNFEPFSANIDIDWNTTVPPVKAYIATGINENAMAVTLQRVNKTPAGTGVLVSGLTAGEIHLITATKTKPAAVESLLKAGENNTVEPAAGVFVYNDYEDNFFTLTYTATIPRGKIWLYAPGARSSFYLLETIDTTTGDVNGDGLVDVTDMNILVNILVGKESATNYPMADVNGDGNVDVSDVNAVINIMLDK